MTPRVAPSRSTATSDERPAQASGRLIRRAKRAVTRNTIVRLSELADEVAVSRESLYRWERQGIIPPRRKFGPATTGWLRSEIDAWLASREATVPSDAA